MKTNCDNKLSRNMELARRMRAGDSRARWEMIEMNIPLVPVFAVRFLKNRKYLQSADFDSLIGEGYLGLIEAVDHFDPDRGVSFSAYARYKIYAYFFIEMAKQSSTIDIPLYLTWTHKKKPVNAEFLEAADQARKPFYQVYEEVLPDQKDFFEEVEFDEIRSIMEWCIRRLSDIEKRVVEIKFFSGCDVNNQEIADEVGITSLKVKRILEKARLIFRNNTSLRKWAAMC